MDEIQLQAFRIERLKELSNKFGGNTELGRKLGYASGAHIGNLISGFRPITEKFIIKAESTLRLDGWFNPNVDAGSLIEVSTEPGIKVPLLDAAASMGNGEASHIEDAITGALTLAPNWIAQNLYPITNPLNLRFIHAYGDSMEPTFKSGDILLVDSGTHEIDIDGIYVLEAQKRLFVKRVTQDVFGKVTVSSDNPNVKTVSVLNGDHEVEVLGRVLWVWDGRKL